jgi:hypothetical protein
MVTHTFRSLLTHEIRWLGSEVHKLRVSLRILLHDLVYIMVQPTLHLPKNLAFLDVDNPACLPETYFS